MSTRAVLEELLSQHVEVRGPDQPLELQSLELVMLAEAIEERFGLRLRASDVVPENFGTLARLVAFVDRSRRP